ncbi:MAG: hypothetical protein ACI8V0_001077 [Pseudohongiellaceae bacterium]|jgi:hypothetical protein
MGVLQSTASKLFKSGITAVARALCLAGLLSLTLHGAALHSQSLSAGQVAALAQVTGPVAVSALSHPFGAADHTLQPQDMAALGYIEEEFFISGNANVYDWPERDTLEVRTPDVPYTTRLLIRRPAQAARFSGNVVVEMLNPSNLFDLNIAWAMSHTQMLRNGDAWVGITAKPIAVETLKQFDAQRYAPLSWANPLAATDPMNCEVSRDTTQATENGLIWDIHTQVGTWLKSADSTNPFNYNTSASMAQKLYAWGYSQTGSFLYTYLNAIHPQVTKARGKSLFDGYLVAVSSGPSPINQCAPRIARDDPRRPIQNAGVPVIHIMSQSDYLFGIASRQPDSDSPNDQFRRYEIAGSGHASPDELYWGPKPADLLTAGRAVPPLACNEGPRSRFPNRLAFNAALVWLDQWARNNIAPPHADLIQVVDGQPVLDEHANVIGGLRSPYVDVPTSTWNGNSTGESFCRIAGHEIPFSAEKLKALYPTHSAYVNAVSASVRELVSQGFLLEADGAEVIQEAQQTNAP